MDLKWISVKDELPEDKTHCFTIENHNFETNKVDGYYKIDKPEISKRFYALKTSNNRIRKNPWGIHDKGRFVLYWMSYKDVLEYILKKDASIENEKIDD